MISFSGIDCGGKSTQIEKIYETFKAGKKKYEVIHSRIGYTPMLEFFKNLIRKDKNKSAEEKAEYRNAVHSNSKKRKLLLWMSIMDMALYYGIYFRLKELFGTTILADRYFWDSCIDLEIKFPDIDYKKWLVWKFFNKIYLKPEHSVIYVIPAEVSMYRSTLKDEPWPEPIEIRQLRIDKYMNEIERKRWHHVIDSTKSIEEVYNETMELIKP